MRLLLAPMESVTDHHLRTILTAIGGIDVCVTEFIRVNDLPLPARALLKDAPELPGSAQKPTNTPIETATETATESGSKTECVEPRRISTTPSGVPVRVQLLGSNPETVAETARRAALLGAAAIDLNFGCPAKTVNKSRGGSILLKEPDLVGSIVKSVRQHVPANVPVTAKIRLGFEDRSRYLDNALAIAAAGANELCVHARSRADGYTPPAYWSYIAHIVENVSIPVIANGEIWSVADWQRCKEESRCSDFMLGRGLIACPDLALQIRAAAVGASYQPLTWAQVVPLLQAFYLATKDVYPAKYLGNRVKQWLFYLQMHYAEASAFFERVKRYKRHEDFAAAFADYSGTRGQHEDTSSCESSLPSWSQNPSQPPAHSWGST